MANKNKNPNSVPLAIVGVGCLFPKANDARQYWHNIRQGIDAITDIPDSHWDPADYFNDDKAAPDMTYARRGGFIDPVDFDPLLYGLSPNNIEATDTTQLLGMVVARQALLDAGYSTSKDNEDGRAFDRNRTSVILGVTGTLELVIPLGARLGHPHWRKALAEAGVAEDVAEDVMQRIADSYVPWQENSFPGLLGNVAAGRIANRFDLGGTNCVVDAACASSLSAIHMAALELYSGRADMAITGGFDTFNDIFMYMCFSKTPALSPTGNSRPFDINGDGTILGEGLGAIILKRLNDAQRDNDKIYAVIKGMGSSSDGRGNAIYAPSANGQTRALKNAYADAGVEPQSIELVEAHGTGTRVGDAVETEALSSVYREVRQDGTWCALGSVKSMIGHTKAAAGVAGLIKLAMALKYKVLPPTIKIDKPLEILNPGAAPVYVNTYARPWLSRANHPRRAALSAFGFGGSNFHCVVEEADPLSQETDWDGNVLIYSCSNKTRSGLVKNLKSITIDQDWDSLRYQAASSREKFKQTDDCRLILVITRQTDLKSLIHDVCLKLEDKQATSWNLMNSAYYGEGKPSGKLALLFPGQGSQYTDMQLDLACQFPEVQNSIANASQIFETQYPNTTLGNLIYPIPVFTDEEKHKNTENLRQTQHAQPAIGATSIGLFNALTSFGIKADMTAGHSFGELTALCAAGVIDESSLINLAIKRGELMASNDNADRGSMLAVSASAAVVHEILEAEQLDLIIANNNAPRQVVLSGATAQIDKAVEVLDKRGLGAKKLPVSAAFHSSFIAAAEKPFASFLEKIEFSKPAVPVFSNSTAEPYPAEPEKARALLASQLARPVEFVSEIENLYEAGARTFVEVGPGNVITGLVTNILGDKDFNALSLDASRGRKPGQYDLACTLAQIACLGYQVDLYLWDADFIKEYQAGKVDKPSMTIPLTGANYMKPREKRPPVQRQQSRPAPIVKNDAAVEKPDRVPPANTITGSGTQNVRNRGLLQVTQQTILSLQKMQQQTAELHRQYLEGQEAAQKTIQSLLDQNIRLQSGEPVERIEIPPVPMTTPPASKPVVTQPPVPKSEEKIQASNKLDIKDEQADNELESMLLEVVAEKTGYPVDMLSLEMSLDTDLGIDSIKRVEILSALHEKLPGAEAIQPEELGTFRLLKHIAEFLVANHTQPQAAEKTTKQEGPTESKVSADVQTILFQVVSEKTGYPMDMLNADMNLDTDLGIDSIKRVEILSAFQEKVPEAPAMNPDDLATLQTLQQIVDYMQVSTPDTVLSEDHGKLTPNVASNLGNTDYTNDLLQVVAEKTGYPADMLDTGMNLDTDLGIDSIKRVEILSAFQEKVPQAPAMNPDDLANLQTLQQIIDYMQQGNGPIVQTSIPVQQPVTTENNQPLWRGVLSMEPVTSSRQQVSMDKQGEILVTDDGIKLTDTICQQFESHGYHARKISIQERVGEKTSGLVIMVPETIDETFICDTLELIQHHASDLKGSVNKTGLLSVITRMGGAFGLDSRCDYNPESAAIGGLIKTIDKEWEYVNCHLLDIQANSDDSPATAEIIVQELLTHGPLETGIQNDKVNLLKLDTKPVAEEKKSTRPLPGKGETIVISGGARGITAEIAIELASEFGSNLLLLGRSPVPESEPSWLPESNNAVDIKQAIIQNSERAMTPKEVESMSREIMAAREVRQNLERARSFGVEVLYLPVDIRDAEQVSRAIDQASNTLGPVTGIVHGAGILADKLFEDKTSEQFHDVYSTKVYGLKALLQATVDDDLKVLVTFSSTTARFGRKGQSDYAAANEVLNKMARIEAVNRQHCKVVSLNWGPWDGGMVTPQLRKLFEQEGIGVIPLQAGAKQFIKELQSESDVEVVILGSQPPEQEKKSFNQTSEHRLPHPALHLAYERTVSINNQPILNSHIMNGKAVLPAAIIIEWFAHGALHNNPGLVFSGVDNFKIYKGVIIDSGETLNVQVLAGDLVEEQGQLIVPVELKQGQTLHAGATIILDSSLPKSPAPQIAVEKGNYSKASDEIYNSGQLFHGPDLQGITAISGYSESGISATAKPSPKPSSWMTQPIRKNWLADPLLLDSAFQLMILWSFENSGTGSLPTGLSGYHQFKNSFPTEEVEIRIKILSQNKHSIQATIEFIDNKGELVAQIDNYECVVDGSLNTAFKNNRLIDETQS